MPTLTPTINPAASTLSPDTIARLGSVSILTSLDETSLHYLDGATELHLAAETVLVRQGETARFFWILLSGSLRMANNSSDGHESMIYTMHEGTAFGEVPLLANIPSAMTVSAAADCSILQLDEEHFWSLMTHCPRVREAILGNMAMRLAKMQAVTFQQEKMASLGTLAAGLMHELNNPGSAAQRAASRLRDNVLRMHALTAKFTKTDMKHEQKQCMFALQERALSASLPAPLNSIEQADAEDALTTWMDEAHVEDAWKLASTLVSIGLTEQDLEVARDSFPSEMFSDTLNWLEALVSSMQLVGIVEESISRVTDLVHAVKSYAYEGIGEKQTIDLNASIHATLVILSHKFREKQIKLEKSFAPNLACLQTKCQGVNQIWTNLLDNAIDAVPQSGTIGIRTWSETINTSAHAEPRTFLCAMFRDNGPGIPPELQSRIFDPFFTTKPVGVGTGLGLGIVFRIVEQCGGTIRFTSSPGETEFVVHLPVTNS